LLPIGFTEEEKMRSEASPAKWGLLALGIELQQH
jgi:hypothetical protein